MYQSHPSIQRAREFSARLDLQVPILLAPMAGACPVALSIAVSRAGGMGACGALLMSPSQIAAWSTDVRSAVPDASLQLNTWIPDPEPARNAEHEAQVQRFLSVWEQEMGVNSVAEESVSVAVQNFEAQCEAMLEAQPQAISSIMGVFPEHMVESMKRRHILWFATATTVAEAVLAVEAGADVIVAQGMEAGGHRGAFNAADAEVAMVGLFALLPAIVDAVNVPVVASGGIADARGAAAALLLGASAVQIGTGLLRAHESGIASAWADAIAKAAPEETVATRAFSGRLGRSINSRYVAAANSPNAPSPAPYPLQRSLTQEMRTAAARNNNIDAMQAWAGQSARLARSAPAADIIEALWREVKIQLRS